MAIHFKNSEPISGITHVPEVFLGPVAAAAGARLFNKAQPRCRQLFRTRGVFGFKRKMSIVLPKTKLVRYTCLISRSANLCLN
jgi:hypothetical protein